MNKLLHPHCFLPLLLSAATLSAQALHEVKPAKGPDPIKGMHDASPLSASEQARLRTPRRPHASGPVAERILGEAAGVRADRLLFDEPGDGHVWALAATYKASFGIDGFTYIPFLGSDAPRNYPVQFVLRAVRVGGRQVPVQANAPAVRSGSRVTFDRGAVHEVYDLSPTHAEQTFVVDTEQPGDVEVDIEIVSDLREVAGGPGLRLGNALGSVDYGTAYLVDGSVKTPIASALSGRTIRLHVDAAKRGVGTVVIDPIISTTATNWAASSAATDPDIAYDATTDRYLVVQELLFSSTDSDVVCEMRDGNGGPVAASLGVIDATPRSNQRPRVANLSAADRFLVVTQEFNPQAAPGQQSQIVGRVVEAQSPFRVGLQFQVSDPLSFGDKFAPDIGGDPSTSGTTYWTVVYTRALNDSDWDIHGRQVDANGTPRPATILIDNTGGTIFTSPQISLSNAHGSATAARWLVVYSFRFTGTDWDVYGASLDQDGNIARVSGPIDTAVSNDLYPFVSSPSLDWTNDNPVFMVTYERQSPQAMMATVVSAQLVRIVPPTDLSTRYGFGPFWCRPESDGCRFAVTHGHGAATNEAIEVATLAVADGAGGARFVLHEASQPLARTTPPFTVIRAATPMLASKHSGGGVHADYCVAFVNRDVAPEALYVTSYEGRTPGAGTLVRATGCDGLGLGVTGRPFLGETMRFALTNFGTDLYGELLGLPGPSLPLCGAGCAFGLALDGPVVNAPNNRLLTVQIPCSLNVVGARIAVQGYSFGSGSCLSLFRFSDTIDVTIR
ncbi:MAG: hypothetical protein R3F56_00550 [Planctomycetota bacterium]